MRILKSVSLIAAIVLMSVSANAQKFGHINSADLLKLMPEVKTADTKLQEFGTQLDAQLKTMSTEYQTKVADYQAKSATMADAVKTVKEKEINDLGDRIQQFQQSAQDDITKKKEEFYGPILKKAEDAIIEVAKTNSYAYIFDKSAGGLIYAIESEDIMPLVKKKLGIL